MHISCSTPQPHRWRCPGTQDFTGYPTHTDTNIPSLHPTLTPPSTPIACILSIPLSRIPSSSSHFSSLWEPSPSCLLPVSFRPRHRIPSVFCAISVTYPLTLNPLLRAGLVHKTRDGASCCGPSRRPLWLPCTGPKPLGTGGTGRPLEVPRPPLGRFDDPPERWPLP